MVTKVGLPQDLPRHTAVDAELYLGPTPAARNVLWGVLIDRWCQEPLIRCVVFDTPALADHTIQERWSWLEKHAPDAEKATVTQVQTLASLKTLQTQVKQNHDEGLVIRSVEQKGNKGIWKWKPHYA
jgi:hypothetical protein